VKKEGVFWRRGEWIVKPGKCWGINKKNTKPSEDEMRDFYCQLKSRNPTRAKDFLEEHEHYVKAAKNRHLEAVRSIDEVRNIDLEIFLWQLEDEFNAEIDKDQASDYLQQEIKVRENHAGKCKMEVCRYEKEGGVPYKWLREKLKNHQNTKDLVCRARDSGAPAVYLSLVDKDTLNFNGIYEAYQKIYKQHKTNPPIVVSTGYVFGNALSLSEEERQIVRPLIIASYLDRAVRAAIASNFSAGIYYPEPNLCVLIESEEETLHKGFAPNDKDQQGESAALLHKINQDRLWIFTDKHNPIVTTIPYRAARNKKPNSKGEKNMLGFKGSVLTQKGALSDDDFSLFAQVAQSHMQPRQLASYLSINGGFALSRSNRSSLKKELAGVFTKSLRKDFAPEDLALLPEKVRKQIKKGLNQAKKVVQSYKEKVQDGSFFNDLYNDDKRSRYVTALLKTLSAIPKAKKLENKKSFYTYEGQTYRESAIPGDGDCGFHGLGVTRAAAVERVIQILQNPSDPLFYRVLNALTAEMREVVLANDPEVADFIEHYIPDAEEVRHYVRQTYRPVNRGGAFLGYGLNQTGMMAAVALAFDREVHVFINTNGVLNRVFHGQVLPGRTITLIIRMIHTAAGVNDSLNHFNRLELVVPTSVSIRATTSSV
jgi:hypothetical protein